MAIWPLQQRIQRDLPNRQSSRSGVATRLLITLIASVVCGSISRAQPVADGPGNIIRFVTGGKFDEELSKPLSLSWTDQPLRSGLRKLSELRNVNILLDRRIDPDRKLTVQIGRVPLDMLFARIAESAQCGISVVGNTIYIGPPATTRILRTVIELRSRDLVAGPVSAKRPLGLLHRRTLSWEDLEAPAELVQRAVVLFSLEVEGLEMIPHDLWAAGSIATATPPEMLLLILAQFDLSFEWTDAWKGIRITAMPTDPRIERIYDLRGKPAAALVREWTDTIPDLKSSIEGSRATIAGTIEQHEQIDGLLHSNRTRRQPAKGITGAPRVTFTFELKNARLTEIIETLEQQSDFRFEYDADTLRQAGASLDRRVTLKMTNASPDELFHAMFDESGIIFETADKTVRLKPKPP